MFLAILPKPTLPRGVSFLARRWISKPPGRVDQTFCLSVRHRPSLMVELGSLAFVPALFLDVRSLFQLFYNKLPRTFCYYGVHN